MIKEYEPLYTVKEVSKILKISLSDTYDLINSGQLKSVVIGSRKIRGSDLEHFIETHPVE